MRILQVISSADPAGGGPIEGALQLDRLFRDFGHETRLVTLDDPGADCVLKSSAAVIPLGPSVGTYGFSRRFVPWLRSEAHKWDAVITHGLWQYLTRATRSALRTTGIPYYSFTHGMLDPYFKRRYPLKHLKKLVYWTAFEHDVLRDAAAVLFTCEEEKLLARQSFARYSAREQVVSFGTALPAGQPEQLAEEFLAEFPDFRSHRVLLFLGRIHEKKGCDMAIQAFSQCAADERILLVMAGPGDPNLVSSLKALAEREGIGSRVVWTGMLMGNKKWGALASADAFLLPSHQENFGVAVVEALAMGTPVLISDKVNIWREIEVDQAGFVADDTVEGTVRNIRAWLALGDEESRRLRQRARQSFEQRFQMLGVAQRLVDLMQAGKR